MTNCFSLADILQELDETIRCGLNDDGLDETRVVHLRDLIRSLEHAGFTVYAEMYSDIVSRSALEHAVHTILSSKETSFQQDYARFSAEVLETFFVCSETFCKEMFPKLTTLVHSLKRNPLI